MKKDGFEFSFSWIFAFIAGAAILFIAIYTSGRIIKTGEYEQATQTASKLTALFEPLGVAGQGQEAKSGKISLNSQIKIYSECFTDGTLGRGRISIAEKKSFTDKEYGQKGVASEFSNKYVFFEEEAEGRDFNYFTKSFNSPFKVADLLIITGKNYCFVNPPTFIEDDINSLGINNIIVKNSISECLSNKTITNKSQVVCFDSGSMNTCGAIVRDDSGGDYENGEVESITGVKTFFGELIYPAIFSKKNDYECNIKRIMMREANLARLYSEKSKLLSIRGVCESGAENGLITLENAARSLKTSRDLPSVKSASELINQNGVCQLW